MAMDEIDDFDPGHFPKSPVIRDDLEQEGRGHHGLIMNDNNLLHDLMMNGGDTNPTPLDINSTVVTPI
jgi:hypothetical protein